MALTNILKGNTFSVNNDFYRYRYHYFLLGLIGLIIVELTTMIIFGYQISHRSLPTFNAVQPNGQQMSLTPHTEPNLLPDTILRFAVKAAVSAYTFNFADYENQLTLSIPYFTDAGWKA